MKHMINMTACMMLITLSQGLSCSEKSHQQKPLDSLDISELAFHDVASTNSSPKNSRNTTSSHPVLSIELPDLTSTQKEEGKFQDLFANLTTEKKDFEDEEFEPSSTSSQRNNRRLLSPHNYFNESPEEFEANIESLTILEQTENFSKIELKGRFKDDNSFIFYGHINSDLLKSLTREASSQNSKEEFFTDEDQNILEEIAPIEEISLNQVEENNLPNTLEKKTAYFTVQNGVIATTALASLATSYIFLRNRK